MSWVCVAFDRRPSSAPASMSMFWPFGNSMSVASAWPMATKEMRMPSGFENFCGATAMAAVTAARQIAGMTAKAMRHFARPGRIQMRQTTAAVAKHRAESGMTSMHAAGI